MKKLSLIIIGIVYSISCYGQKVALSDSLSIELPKGATSLTRDKFSTSVNEKFSNSKIAPVEAYEFALLETFGNGITLYVASAGSSNYEAMTLSTDQNNNVVISIKFCP